MIDYIIAPLVILIAGISLLIFPPATRHQKYGYRSKQALSSPAKWKLAQKLAGPSLTWLGGLALLMSLLLFYFRPSDPSRFLSVAIPVIGLLIIIRQIEKRLKKIDNNGTGDHLKV